MLNHIIPQFNAAQVLVYGDLMLDRYWYGQTSRISPEAPVPIVHIQQSQERPGGAANVALNLAALGSGVKLIGVVGEDAEARTLQSVLERQQVECHFLTVNHPTTTKLRVIGQQQQLIRMDFEELMRDIDHAALIHLYSQHLEHVHSVVLSDYAKGALLHHAAHLIRLAVAKKLPVLVDPKSTDFSCYRGATLITPNLKEFEAVVGVCHSEIDIELKARRLLDKFAFEAVLVTRGRDGMTLVVKDKSVIHMPARAREVFDVTGAGDTVIAVIAAALTVGEALENAVSLANLAAGIVVSKLGADTVTVAELRQAARERNRMADGVVTEEELMTLVADARTQGETIVMTNGCFDILHPGHIQYLYQAKALGRRLIIAVNDDASVARLKGPTRPFNALMDRMLLLAALRMVDWVVPFSEDTPVRLIDRVAPDVLVKGGDYELHQIAGSESVLSRGGRVIVLDFKPGYSTSALIHKALVNQPLNQEEVMI